jgi:hypothetical protein
VGVRAPDVGAALEEDGHQPLVAGRARHAEQVVAVRAARGHELRVLVELRAQAVDVVRLDRPVRRRERRARRAQAGDVLE